MIDDLISRKAAIDALEWKWAGKAAFDAIKNLPSAQPEPNKGHWTEKEVIYIKDTKDAIDAWQSCRCSECGRYDTRPYMYFFSEPRFCSHCGAEMKGESDEESL